MTGFATTNKHPKARYYVLEGPDGTGKTTQAQMLAHYFCTRLGNDRVLLTSQPWYAGHRGDLIKRYLRKELHLAPGDVFDCYVDNRVAHLRDVVVPALEAGKVVIQDRSYYSTLAYQGSQGLPLDQIVMAHRGMRRPDQVFIMQVPLAVAMKRLRQRHAATGHAPETFETPKEQEQIARLFAAMPNHFPDDPLYFVNAEGPETLVHGVLKQMTQRDLELLLQQ